MANPCHHTNTTAISDWAFRRPHSHLHLLQRYSTAYWKTLAAAAAGVHDLASMRPFNHLMNPSSEASPEASNSAANQASCNGSSGGTMAVTQENEKVAMFEAACAKAAAGGRRVVAPLVSKHFDFLQDLMERDADAMVTKAAQEQTKAATPSAAASAAVVDDADQRTHQHQQVTSTCPPHVFGVSSGCISATLASPHVCVLFGSAPVGPTTVRSSSSSFLILMLLLFLNPRWKVKQTKVWSQYRRKTCYDMCHSVVNLITFFQFSQNSTFSHNNGPASCLCLACVRVHVGAVCVFFSSRMYVCVCVSRGSSCFFNVLFWHRWHDRWSACRSSAAASYPRCASAQRKLACRCAGPLAL